MFHHPSLAEIQAAAQASAQAAVHDAEARTGRAIEDLRTDLKGWRQEFVPRERIEDRWKRDDARLADHDRAIDALQRGQAEMQRAMAQLATKDDIAQTVKDATGSFASTADVEQAISASRKLRLTSMQQAILFCLAVLGFLSGTGLIHPLALFTGVAK